VLTDAGRLAEWLACCCLKEEKRVWTASRGIGSTLGRQKITT